MRYIVLSALVLASVLSAGPRPRIYLGGPDVFYPNPKAIAEKKKAIAERYGFEGVFPLDNDITPADSPLATGLKVFRANVDLMKTCDLMIANMTPFRGPSMDAGTAYEMGFMYAAGKPVLGYTEDERDFTRRTIEFVEKSGGKVIRQANTLRDADRFSLENFGMADNLMLHGTVATGGAAVEHSFEDVLRKNARRLLEHFAKKGH